MSQESTQESRGVRKARVKCSENGGKNPHESCIGGQSSHKSQRSQECRKESMWESRGARKPKVHARIRMCARGENQRFYEWG
jgi:hypothetical protein